MQCSGLISSGYRLSLHIRCGHNCEVCFPGMQEERPFTNAMATALGRDPNLGELALLRRLLHECYALVSAELQSSVERVEDAPVKKLAQPERADRLKKQQAKLSGLRIVGKLVSPRTD